ncbi:hypothetical protein A4X09_0g178 [Tilletia walkeri]|uniref:Uncharacterized protein n=1 Tax=Tilletia walkeri TaxID=117179 RepID=A0A8X7T7Y3_9BASI|nr:hypothetical protein A4X09_0g178 [Tilletia walkeri]
MSSLTSIAAVVLGPLLLRKGIEFFRGGLRSSISGFRSVPSPFTSRAPPAELLLLALTFSLTLYHTYTLLNIVFFPATNRVTDVFLASDTPVNAASVLLRERVAKHAQGMFERLTDTYVPAGAAVEELFRRLTSFEGRKIYLMVGEEPLLYCVFCVKPNDYKLYTLPLRLAAYGAHFVFFGILTLGDPTLSLINTTLSPSADSGNNREDDEESEKDSDQDTQLHSSGRYQPSRAAWRRSVLLLLLSGLTGELFALHSFADVRNGSGRWNHWHVNILLARHALFLLMSIIIYLVPTAPELVSVETSEGYAPSALQGALHALNSTTNTLQLTLAHLQALTLSTDVVLNDSGLRALREQKAVELAEEAAAAAVASPIIPTVGTEDANGTPASPSVLNGTSPDGPSSPAQDGAPSQAEADSLRLRQRQAGLVRLAKRAGIDVDTVRRESRGAAEAVLKDTERRAREIERRNAEARAKTGVGAAPVVA